MAGGQSCAATLSACGAGTCRVATQLTYEDFRRPCAALGGGVLAARELPPAIAMTDDFYKASSCRQLPPTGGYLPGALPVTGVFQSRSRSTVVTAMRTHTT